MALVSSMIWLEKQLLVRPLLLLHCLPLVAGQHLALLSAKFYLIITKSTRIWL